MTVTTIRAFEVVPGRREEFIGVLAEGKRLFEANGSIVRAAETFYGGETAGRVTMLNAFTGLDAMSEFLQKMRQLEAPNPILAALESDDPPARSVAASVLDDVTPRQHDTLVTERAVASVTSVKVAPGQEAAAIASLDQLQDQAEARGGELRAGRLRWAGPLTGMFILATAYESGEQLAAAEAAREAANDPPHPLIESGAVQIVTSALLTRIEL